MKSTLFGKRSQRWVLSLLIPAFAFLDSPLQANPSGGTVVHGQALINQVSAKHLKISQQTQTAIINWADFSIGADELTQFVQPNSSASVLNRVTGGNISQIHGALQGNGNVFVVNPNGIVIGSSGVIDVGGNAILSTLDIDDQDFIDGGPSRFYGNSTTGVSNFGTITSAGGDVVLLGGFVDNQGQIGAMNGTVALGSGGDILLEQGAGGAQITVQGASDYTGTGINNAGDINGTAVEMKAHGNVYALAINNTGMVRASGATRSNGRVRLQASGGSSNINLGSTSQVYATRGGTGGDVEIVSESGDVAVGGLVNVNGSSVGGSVEVVGRNVSQAADSVVSANGVTGGGSVAMDAVEEISVAGTVSATSSLGDGGVVEITGDEVVVVEDASLSVDGFSEGGRLRVGGEFQGADGDLREATNTRVGNGASLTADSSHGDAGSVVVWANNDTLFYGDVSASASGIQGDGGLVEVSGKVGLALGGTFRANAVNGEAGTVLFDPGSLTVGYFNGAGGINEIEVATINDTLQNGTSVLLLTEGVGSNITFEDIDLTGQQAGGAVFGGTIDGGIYDYDDPNHPRNLSIQWTNSNASFGAFAGGSIFINNHIRTSGGGSVNLIAGWTGLESDFEAGGIFDGIGFSDPVGGVSEISNVSAIESAFQSYLGSGDFGQNGGSIFVGSSQMTRHVEVGSRYGNTNLAASVIAVTASDTGSESRYAQVGFRDSGGVFAARFNQTGSDYDLNVTTALTGSTEAVVVGVIGDSTDGIVSNQEADIDGDGIPDGVYAIVDGEIDTDTFIPYANHYNSSRTGNWWWQQIHEESVVENRYAGAAADIGGNRPEMGAGSATDYANINVIATGDILVLGGGSNNSGAQIGHGGDSAGSLEDRADRNGGVMTNDLGTTARAVSQNGAMQNRSSTSIARLAPVYGGINVLAGVNAAEGVSFSSDGATGAATVSATVNDGGSVIVSGIQRVSSGVAKTNPESNQAGTGAASMIGHGGLGQFGQYYGDIDVEADGDVTVRAGSNSRMFASIGHNIATYHYWNPSDVEDSQIRFFRSIDDFDLINLRRDALFAGGTVEVEDVGGSTINGFHGDISVKANSGDIYVKAYDTPTAAEDEFNLGIPEDGLETYRDNRFARIGHGGSSEEVVTERLPRDGEVSTNDNGLERVILRITNTDSESEHLAQSTAGSGVNRSLTFLTITGDIEVEASGDTSVIAGNGNRDIAQIGHGGTSLADFETSGVIAGDVSITTGGALTIIGGGLIDFTGVRQNTNNNTQQNPYGRNFAMVGHGGYFSGFLGFFGDIDVVAGDDITATAGGENQTFAKIGHQGYRDWGQVGGSFTRDENFIADTLDLAGDKFETDVTTTVTETEVTRTFSDKDDPDAIEISGNTANISVTSTDGDILLNHKGQGVRENANQVASNADPNNNGEGLTLVDDAYTQIGHGGINTDALRVNNPNFAFRHKIGDIEVNAFGGDITLENGNGSQRWTRIGHGLGVDIAGSGALSLDQSITGGNGLFLAGDISIFSAGSVSLDASAADAYGNPNRSTTFDSEADGGVGAFIGDASQLNPVAIGHGSVLGATGVVVVSDGSDVNGIAASSDITLDAATDLNILGGDGYRGSSAQLGHGTSDNDGNSGNIRKDGQPAGFDGDITVNVGRDINLIAGTRPWVLTENATDLPISVVGAFAAIGNGGYGVDAGSSGEIQVYAGRDLNLEGQDRLSVFGEPVNSNELDPNAYSQVNNGVAGADGENIASVFAFAKIGHFSVENERSNASGGRTDAVVNANSSGDITVVVDRNLTMTGGKTYDEDMAPILGAFTQIGHGGPGIGGDLEGDITVLVGNDLVAEGGELAVVSTTGLNNYTMIGHGDRVVDPGTGEAVFYGEGIGDRDGDIVIAVGDDATFTDVLVGHADPLTSTQQTTGTLQVAVSRNNPFYGGGGVLTTNSVGDSDTVFASGTNGSEQLEFYIPERRLNKMSADTRLNESVIGFTVAPGNFAGFDGTGSETTGRDDEVYLTPDLWWDDAGIAEANDLGTAGVFPTDASGDQGGSIAEVSTPGGLENLTTLSAGALGSSATLYRGGNGVSGAGLYTIYYDAVETVETAAVPGPPAPVPPTYPAFQFINFVFGDQYDSFTRYRQFLEDEETGQSDSIFGSLALYETDEVDSEEAGAMKIENRLDDMFGKRRNSYSEEERDEEEVSRRRRGRIGVGGIGLTYYVYDPGTNRYSSYRVFGTAFERFYPVN
ncbi:MAG: filamentous hemagglutinin N-terminal domain-containing protein [Verrucomicrobiales bacterium]|nr:filamentous hemagglutinin N-terminal domain-containing protein [Verrucomicrobiales bacterium]